MIDPQSPDSRWRIASFAVLLAMSLHVYADDGWTRFQNGDRPVAGNGNLATDWSPESGLAWQKPIAGYGQSSPAISGGIVYVTSVSGRMKDTLHVEAFQLKTGKRAWKFDTKNSSPLENTTYVSKAAPSPVCDGEGVIALFEGGKPADVQRDGLLLLRLRNEAELDQDVSHWRNERPSCLVAEVGVCV